MLYLRDKNHCSYFRRDIKTYYEDIVTRVDGLYNVECIKLGSGDGGVTEKVVITEEKYLYH